MSEELKMCKSTMLQQKVCLFGLEGSGVRSFVNRITHDAFTGKNVFFNAEYQSVELKIKKESATIQVWDNLSYEHHRGNIDSTFIANAIAVVIIIDNSQPNTSTVFKSLLKRIQLMNPKCPIVVVFTKNDLTNQGIDVGVAESILEHKIEFFSVSSKTGDGFDLINSFILSQTRNTPRRRALSENYRNIPKPLTPTKGSPILFKIKRVCKF